MQLSARTIESRMAKQATGTYRNIVVEAKSAYLGKLINKSMSVNNVRVASLGGNTFVHRCIKQAKASIRGDLLQDRQSHGQGGAEAPPRQRRPRTDAE